MSILFSNEIIEAVISELKHATASVQIITAYCKKKSFKLLDAAINQCVSEKRLLLRFRMDDIIKGSTDFSVASYALENGWKVYIRFDLHAKTYIVDNKRGLVGSANATNSGLSIGRAGNMEMAAFVDIEDQDVEKVGKLFDDAISVDDTLLLKLKEQLERVEPAENQERHSWDTSITGLFNPHIDTLFSYELPEDFNMHEGEYFSFLDETFNGDKSKFKETFRWSNSYLWLLKVLEENEGCLYFGTLAEKLHNALISDPKPYRKDVKQMLANLLSLVEELEMEEIEIDRPNYSQRVRLMKIN